ncbi:MAG: MFS transporter [Reyranella sp.]|uniref:MFS transporter n=1 Tax=Reyranella sp. TaxID=1929291 RepID=UPI0012279701|nr:MFS transporter [Reyranella sp.]TAJ88556.1 MAG: MFS transporter [Reyranella sp.]TBR27244.1 MAG: MFS transporter [Reyranella sp.]
MTIAVSTPTAARRTLTVCGGAHALHDGFTDLLNVLYPLLQSQFGLSYGAIGALKTCYSGAMATGQIPSGQLAERFGGVRILAIGTLLIAAGYCLAGLSGSLYGVIAGLLLAGLGASTQHPIGSSLVAAAYHGARSRTALGTYNFTGDVGKVLLPALFALIAAALGWQQALVVMAALAVLGAGIILASLRPIVMHGKAQPSKAVAGQDRPWAYWLLFSIHIADDLVRTGFLIFLPFLLRNKGADLPTIGLGLSLLFAGGAAGKLVMGWVGQKLGVVPSVLLTEAATTLLILAALPLSLDFALLLLPVVGLMLNGTSSVLYGTIPEFVSPERRTKAFAVFYTGGSVAGATGPLLFGLLGDVVGLTTALVAVSCVALTTVPMVWALRPAFADD